MEIERQPAPSSSDIEPPVMVWRPLKIHQLQFTDKVGISFHRGPTRKGRGYRLVLFSLAATAIDILLGFAFASLFILSSSLFMHVGFVHLLQFFNGSLFRLFAVGFIVCVAFYKILFRAYLGSTVGEWACGIRLGKPQERLAKNYVARVLLRSAVVALTGFVVLPALSLLFGRDLAGRISGLYLVRLP